MSLQKILSDYRGLSTETYHFNQSKHRKWFCAWKIYINRIITLSVIRLSGLLCTLMVRFTLTSDTPTERCSHQCDL